MTRILILTALLSALAPQASAQQSPLLGGVTIEPTTDVPLRESPPSGTFGRPGDAVATAHSGEVYAILGRKQMQAGIGTLQTWVEIAPLDAQGNPMTDRTGWAYFGEQGLSASPNFVVTPIRPQN